MRLGLTSPLLLDGSSSSGAQQAAPSISRRRGTGGGGGGRGGVVRMLNGKALAVLGMICVSIFALGLILGARAMGDPTSSSSSPNAAAAVGGAAEAAGGAAAAPPPHGGADSDAVKEIHRLVADSARAEAVRLKAAAARIGQRLRGGGGNGGDGDGDNWRREREGVDGGAPLPGDPNYNPHRNIDDDGHDGGANDDDEEEDGDFRDEVEGGGMMTTDLDERDEMEKQEEFVRRMEKDETEDEENSFGNRGRGAASSSFFVDMFPPDNGGKPEFPDAYLGGPVLERHDFSSYVPPGGDRFSEWKDGSQPYAITPDLMRWSDDVARTRRVHVKNAMRHAWDGYRKYAFGRDEVLPLSHKGNNNWGGMGTTLVDSLDTLWLMDMKDEFMEGRDWVRDRLNHDTVDRPISLFETTIRSLGGLLSAYDWSGDVVFLEKAKDLGSRLVKAFDSPSGIPYGSINIVTGRATNFGWAGNNAILSELGTLQLEFRYLARATGMRDYAAKAERVYELLKEIEPANGLFPLYVRNSKDKPEFSNQKISFGAMGDSLYEYMLKTWLQGGKTESMYRDMYDKSIQGMHDELLQKSTPNGLTYIADKVNGRIDHKMDHLACFMGGLLALGAYTDPQGIDSQRAMRDLKTAKEISYTCYQMYARMKTGISPEFAAFAKMDRDFSAGNNARYYILRPETIESFFILNKLTGDPIYREWGWEIFQSIERYCKTDVAYGSLHDVTKPELGPEDRMESFFLAETIKYLYLLFDPDTEVDIVNKHVFNTEAHPFRIFPEFDESSLAVK